MTAQKQLSVDECFAALTHERAQNSLLTKELEKAEKKFVTQKNRINSIDQSNRRLTVKNKSLEEKKSTLVSFKNSDELVISQECLFVANGYHDVAEISMVLHKLRPFEDFWVSVKALPVIKIINLLRCMKTDKGFDLVVARLNLGITLLGAEECTD